MSDPTSTPQPVSPPHVVGEGYEFDAIRKHLGGDFAAPHFVIHKGDTILGVCVGLMWHPLAESDPGEIWVGNKEDLIPWGTKLADVKGPFPVYVRREQGGKWYYIGLREVTGSTKDVNELKKRVKPPTITAISRIVFLKKSGA